jgi:tetratricopeptide (TPR) repeat protein
MSPAELVDHLEAQENYYALLGVSTQAPRATISTVASALIRSLSKAMTGAAGDEIAGRAKRQFDRINKAGEVLTHRQRRATYDALHLPIPPASGTDLIAAESDFKRGRLCMAQENMERARGWFERAAAQDPHQAIYQVYLGWATFGLTADTNRRARLKALELAKDALKTDPSRDDGHVLVGQMHQAMGSHDAAVRAFQKALEVNGGNADARAALAALEEDPQKRPNNRLFGKLFTRR